MVDNAPSYLIVGVTGGIGRAVAMRVLAQGGRVVGVARDASRLDALRDHAGFHFVERDVVAGSDPFPEVIGASGPFAGAALCVGSILIKPAHLTTDDEWTETLALNLTPAFRMVRAFGKPPASGCSLVFCSSAAARVGLPNHEAIAAAKAGIEGLVRSAAATYAAKGIRVNAVAPGLVETPLARKITDNPGALKASVAAHPLGRIGQPDDVAEVMAWLLGPSSSWVTGQVFGLDGGMSTVRSLR